MEKEPKKTWSNPRNDCTDWDTQRLESSYQASFQVCEVCKLGIASLGSWFCSIESSIDAHGIPTLYCQSSVHAFSSGSTGQVSMLLPFFGPLYSWSLLLPSTVHPQSDAFLSYLTTWDDRLPAWPTHRPGPRDGFREDSKEKHTMPVLLQRICIFKCFKQHAHWMDSQMAIPLQGLVPFPPWGRGSAYRHQAPHPQGWEHFPQTWLKKSEWECHVQPLTILRPPISLFNLASEIILDNEICHASILFPAVQ